VIGAALTLARAADGPPERALVVLAAAIAVVLAFGVWPVAGHAITAAHEGGHAAMAVVDGGRTDGVRLYRDRSGETTSWHDGDSFLTTFVGYLAPSIFGVLGALLLAHGRADAVLWASFVLLALLLTTVRNLFGAVVVTLVALLLLATVRRGSADVQTLVACTWVWFLLLGGLVHVAEDRGGGGDHLSMGESSHIPAPMWVGIHLLCAGVALLAGAVLLVGAVGPPV
jgi:hypothetical protein